jgi:hypothetical protein
MSRRHGRQDIDPLDATIRRGEPDLRIFRPLEAPRALVIAKTMR